MAWQTPKPEGLIGVCHTGHVTMEWAQAFFTKLKHPNVLYSFVRGPPIDLARQQIAENLLRNNLDWLFFVDSDVVVREDTLMRLLSYNVPIISALYYRRHPPLIHPCLWKLAKETTCPTCGQHVTPKGIYNPIAEYPKNAIVEVDAIGMGCVVIRRRVFERLKEIDPNKPFFKWTQGWEEKGVCVLPNQLVFGGSLVQEIKKGEEIIDGEGMVGRVFQTYSRPWSGEIIEILPTCIRLPIKVTPEHRILTLQGVKHIFVDKRKTVSKRWRVLDLSETFEEWVSAGELREGDWVAFPIIKPSNSIKSLDISDIFSSRISIPSKVPKEIPISDDLGEFCGLYVAEGSVSNNKDIRLSFGTSVKELLYAQRAEELIEKIFNVNACIVKGDHAFAVKTVSHPLSRLMKLWFGDNATNKHFPKWVFKTSEGFWKSMIKGLWIGDGYCTYSGKYKYPCFGLNTASKELALQTFAILIGLGVRPTLRRYIQPNSAFGRGNPIYVVKVLNDVDRMASIIGVNVPKTRKQEHIRSFFHDGKLWFKVDQIKKLNYEGDVYDLTVEPSNSYILEGMVVHNSEDFYFCQRAIDAGFKILVDTGHVVPHIMEAKVVEDGKLEGLSF